MIVKSSGTFVETTNDLTTTNLSSAMLQLFKYLSFVPVFAGGCGRAWAGAAQCAQFKLNQIPPAGVGAGTGQRAPARSILT